MSLTLAFDVYGTLIDPHAVRVELERHVGDEANRFSQLWRQTQLEYTFRRAAMGVYRDFSAVTRDALDHVCTSTGHDLAPAVRDGLLASYRTLPPFDDVPDALAGLRGRGFGRHAFSNGTPEDLRSLLGHAALDAFLGETVSVHAVETFKPDPRVYAHFNRVTGSDPVDTWLVSSNPFDVIGAVAAGWKAAWVQRSTDAVFDAWEFAPTLIVPSLETLGEAISASRDAARP